MANINSIISTSPGIIWNLRSYQSFLYLSMKRESSFIILLSILPWPCWNADKFQHSHVITSKLKRKWSTKHIIPYGYRLSFNAQLVFFLGGLIVWVTRINPRVRSKWRSCASNINLSFVLQFMFSHAVRLLKLTSWRYDVYGKRQDEISFLPKHGETWFN